MSIDSDCGIMVGLPYEDILQDEGDSLDEMIADGELECTSYYYDSSPNQNIIGFWAVYGHAAEFDLTSLEHDVQEAKSRFFDLLGQEGKIYVGLHIT